MILNPIIPSSLYIDTINDATETTMADSESDSDRSDVS